MKKKNQGAASADAASWVCPHCYRRENHDRYLIGTGTHIPPHQDRRWYFHARGTVGLNGKMPLLLSDPRFLRTEELQNINDRLGAEGASCNIFCAHCHMPALLPLKGALLCGVVTNRPRLAAEFIHTMETISTDLPRRWAEMACNSWLSLPQALNLNYVVRRDRGTQWLCLPDPDATPEDPEYWQVLNNRRVLEAEQYLVLLQLDTHGDLDACLFLEDLVALHGSPSETQAKQAAVILCLPRTEREYRPENHKRLSVLLSYAFGDYALCATVPGFPNARQYAEAAQTLAALAGLTDATTGGENIPTPPEPLQTDSPFLGIDPAATQVLPGRTLPNSGANTPASSTQSRDIPSQSGSRDQSVSR